ncbi:MAG: hypothetical protein ACR2N1_01725 [Rubripirellula sp.]
MNTRSFLTQAETQPKAAGHVSLTFTFPNLRSFSNTLSSRQETQIFATFTLNGLTKNLTKNLAKKQTRQFIASEAATYRVPVQHRDRVNPSLPGKNCQERASNTSE